MEKIFCFDDIMFVTENKIKKGHLKFSNGYSILVLQGSQFKCATDYDYEVRIYKNNELYFHPTLCNNPCVGYCRWDDVSEIISSIQELS